MNLRSGHRVGSSAPPRYSGGADRISALADDLLLLVLSRLRCARTAARTIVLSSRWSGLWTRLPSFVFRDVALPALAAVLDRMASDSVVSVLDIGAPLPDWSPGRAPLRGSVASLLCAAARLSPEQLILALPWDATALYERVELPCFHRATSISLYASSAVVLCAAVGQLSALTTLILSGCTADALTVLVPRCPRLRTLRFKGTGAFCYNGIRLDYITVRSPSLQELVLEVESHKSAHGIEVEAPMLEQLTVSSCVRDDLSVSVLAPMAENVSWHCRYDSKFIGLGDWTLERVSLVMSPPARRQSAVLQIQAFKHRYLWSNENLSWTQNMLAREVEKHLSMQVAADLSVFDLELHLAPLGHVYGAVAFSFLETHRIRAAIHRLKVALPKPKLSTDKVKCKEYYCGCEPNDSARQTITLTELEEVEIDGFQGHGHEFDFLEHLLRCAPMLKRVILRHLDEDTPSTAKVHDFSMAHPSVECDYVESSGHVSEAPSQLASCIMF